MDPLVRVTLTLQQAVTKGCGIAMSLGLGAYLVWWAADPPRVELNLVVAALLAISLVVRLARRLRQAQGTVRRDFVLFSQLFVAIYAGVLHAPGGIDGPFHASVYVGLMLVAGFTSPAVAFASVAFAVALEAGLVLVALGRELGDLVPHAALMGVFAFFNLALFRAEIARVRRLSRSRIESELKRMKEAARTYRLIGAPRQAAEPRSVRPDAADEERLLQSGVDEIHAALRFALELTRQSLSLRSAVVLWLGRGERLYIQEVATTEATLASGPFGARDGICGAALSRGEPVSLVGSRAAKHVPYYQSSHAVGAVCAVPILEHGHARGVLVVDREAADPFTSTEEAQLVTVTRFALRAIENERVFTQLERAKIEQGKLYRATGALSAATTERQVIEAGVNSAQEFTSFEFAAVTLFDRSCGEHEICAVSGEAADTLVGQRFRHNAGLVSMVVANRHALPYRGDYDPARQIVFTRRLAPPQMASLLILPLVVHERALGTLILGSNKRHAFGDTVRPTLEVLASHVAVSLSNARMLKRLEELATTDGLTGVYNKRALIDHANRKLKTAQRYGRPMSVLVCDIDHFKRVNDTYGHDVGDVVIRGLGDLLKRVKRDTDVVGRFGGEEFVVVCEETDERGGELLAERIRSELESTKFPTELGPLSVTCSVGVAPFPRAGDSWEALFKATDEALYVSKRGGRNRVTVWSPKLSGAAA